MKDWRSYRRSSRLADANARRQRNSPGARYKSNDSLLRHFKDTSTLYLRLWITPANGCSTCRCWRRTIKLVAPDDGLTQWSARRMVGKWRMMCEGLDPLAPADENRLQTLPPRGPIISITANSRGCIYSARTLCFAWRYGRSARAAFFPWPDVDAWGESKLAQADNTPTPECCASGLIITARRW